MGLGEQTVTEIFAKEYFICITKKMHFKKSISKENTYNKFLLVHPRKKKGRVLITKKSITEPEKVNQLSRSFFQEKIIVLNNH